jgi:hypothetical protein
MSFARRHHPNPVREQWDRAERWHARLGDAARTREVHVEDHGLVVLQHCWSMHDWLIKGLHSPTKHSREENRYAQADVEQLFQSPELRACRMMANAAKHLDLDPKMKAGCYDGTVVHEYDPRDGSRLTVLAAGQYELLELCAKCMDQIRTFVEAHGWEAHADRAVRTTHAAATNSTMAVLNSSR